METGTLRGRCHCLWSLVAGFARVMIFLGCMIIILIQVGILASLLVREDPYSVMKSYKIIQSFILLLTGIIGCHVSIIGNTPAVKSFRTLLMTSIIMLVIILSFTMNAGAQREIENKNYKSMIDNLPSFDWTNEQSIADAKVSNRIWNSFQMQGCCGINGPGTWDNFRPANVSKNLYPGTCCPPYKEIVRTSSGLCDERYIYSMGCVDRLQQRQQDELAFYSIYIVFQLLLFIISLTVSHHSQDRSTYIDIDKKNVLVVPV